MFRLQINCYTLPFLTGHHSGCPFVALHVTKKTKKPVLAAAAAAADEHSLSPLGKSLIN